LLEPPLLELAREVEVWLLDLWLVLLVAPDVVEPVDVLVVPVLPDVPELPDDCAVAVTVPAPSATAVPRAPAAPSAITPFRAARVRRICCSRLVVMTQSIRPESVCFLGASPA
jgi:hypothetical protein